MPTAIVENFRPGPAAAHDIRRPVEPLAVHVDPFVERDRGRPFAADLDHLEARRRPQKRDAPRDHFDPEGAGSSCWRRKKR